jgi:DDE superfamily endonuclease
MRKVLKQKKYSERKLVINMDETGLNLLPDKKVTWEPKGLDHVYGKTVEAAKQLVTMCLTITAAGKKLPLLIIYKGALPKTKPGATQLGVYKEVSKFSKKAVHTSQHGVWIDKTVMHLWIKKILAPHVKKIPKGKVPLLLLDHASAHMAEVILDAIDDLWVDIIQIPPGVTGFCQPVDISCGGPLKEAFHKKKQKWINAQAA